MYNSQNETNSYKITDTGPVPTAQQTPIIEVLVRVLEKEQAELLELVGALESRLSGVLRKVEPEPLRPDGSSGGQSPLAANLNQRVADASNLAHRIKDIIKRLEV